MRYFALIVKNTVRLEKNSPIINLICRCMNAAIGLSNDVRRDVLFSTIFLDSKLELKLEGSTMRNWRPDSNSTYGLIKASLNGKILPGIKIYKIDSISKYFKDKKNILVPSKKGNKIEKYIKEDAIFLLSWPKNIQNKEINDLRTLDVKIGPKNYSPEQQIVLINHILDRRYL
jgi:tRNA (pseudouridine54-N1)-methyltransferase